MTKDEILNMPAGDALDRLVSEKIFDYVVASYYVPPAYSTDISAAWDVVEKFDHFELSRWVLADGKTFYFMAFLVNFSPSQSSGIVKADTMWLAICRAALLTTL